MSGGLPTEACLTQRPLYRRKVLYTALINRYSRIAVTANERNEQNTTKSLIDYFSTRKPGNILTADIVRIGMVDHYMIFGITEIKYPEIQKE